MSQELNKNLINNNLDNQDIREKLEKQPLKYFSGVIGQIGSIYILHNTYHDRYYVGETLNTHDRMNDHSSDLTRNVHRNSGLQNDFNEIIDLGKDRYDLITCDIHHKIEIMKSLPNMKPSLKDIEKDLRDREGKLVQELSSQGKSVYNLFRERRDTRFSELSPTGKVASNAISISIKGVLYTSITAAAENLKVTTETVRRHLNSTNPKYSDWITLEPNTAVKPPKFKREQRVSGITGFLRGINFTDPFTKKLTFYSSIRECSRSLKGFFNSLKEEKCKMYKNLEVFTSTNAIENRCDNPENETFVWVQDSENTISEKAGSSMPKKLSGHEKIYRSLSQAELDIGSSKEIIKKWCDDPNNKNWFFI